MPGQFVGAPYPREMYQTPLYKAWVQMKTRCRLKVATVRSRYYKSGWPIERILTEGVS